MKNCCDTCKIVYTEIHTCIPCHTIWLNGRYGRCCMVDVEKERMISKKQRGKTRERRGRVRKSEREEREREREGGRE